MESTAPQTKPAPQESVSTPKKAYHSPKLREAGNVRQATEASPSGNSTDGSTTGAGRSLYTFSPV